MALQGRLMVDLMNREGVPAQFLASNLPFPNKLRFLDKLRGVRPFLRSMVFSYEMWKMLASVDVVHILACSWIYFFVVVCPAVVLGRLRGKRVILNYRGGEAAHFFRGYAPLLRPFFRMAHVVTAPSQFLVDVIGKHIGVPVQIVSNIADLDTFRFRERKPLRPKMVVTRHLLKLYDIETVIRAFREVQAKYRDASLSIVGTGDQENYLRGLVSEWKLNNVEFRGYVAHRDLPALYDQCDILLNASRADNFPGSLVEAGASGLVVVSTAVGGIPYIFENEKNAILVDVGDWAALARGVIRILEDPALAQRLASEALRQCRRYAWPNVRRVLYSIYGFEDAPPPAPEEPDEVVGAVGTAGAR
jgi:phenylacetate-CoA ligase